MVTPLPATHFLSPTHARVASASHPGQFHDVRLIAGRWICDADCKGFAYRSTCRHVATAASQPRPFWCARCGQGVAAVGRTLCWTCINHDRDAQADLSLVAPEPEPEPYPLTCWCCRCGERYRFTEQSPLYCPACSLDHVAHASA
jgi:hypothetical protein